MENKICPAQASPTASAVEGAEAVGDLQAASVEQEAVDASAPPTTPEITSLEDAEAAIDAASEDLEAADNENAAMSGIIANLVNATAYLKKWNAKIQAQDVEIKELDSIMRDFDKWWEVGWCVGQGLPQAWDDHLNQGVIEANLLDMAAPSPPLEITSLEDAEAVVDAARKDLKAANIHQGFENAAIGMIITNLISATAYLQDSYSKLRVKKAQNQVALTIHSRTNEDIESGYCFCLRLPPPSWTYFMGVHHQRQG